RARCQRGEFQSSRHDIDAIDGLAIGLLWRVQPFQRSPDQAKGIDALQWRVLWRRDRGRVVDQRAVGSLAAGAVVNDGAILRVTSRGRHAPPARSRFDNAGARVGARLPQRLPPGANRIRVARRLNRQVRIGVVFLIWRRVLGPHTAPIGIELLCENHRDGSVGSLTHLDLGHDESYVALPVDPDEGIGSEARALRGLAGPAWRITAEDAGAPGGQLEESRGRQVGHEDDGWPAACLMACRMRTYVPQRQMLPAMAASMSASSGCGMESSNAVADMI